MLNKNEVILFQGDSITDCGRYREDGSSTGQGYPLLVKAELQYNRPADGLTILNRGISGDRVVDLFARWREDCLELKPTVISILIGVNDIWQERRQCGVDSVKFERVYRMILEETREKLPNARLVLLTPFALEAGATADKWTAYWLPELAARTKAVENLAVSFDATLVSLQPLFDKAAQDAPNEYWLFDGVHPTPAGHRLIAGAWLDAMCK